MILARAGIFYWYLFQYITFVSTNEVALRRLLFQHRAYDQKVCPESGITKVYTNLILLQIESVDEKAQVIKIKSI